MVSYVQSSIATMKISCSGSIFLVGAARDDLQRFVRQRTLQRVRLVAGRAHPDVALLVGREDDGHCLRMDRLDDRVRKGRQESVD